ncbi:hypothetical protein BDA96_10G150700 [Sorghum bicolor]|jgi:hypothetical protein|nr:uncharacterized protein LOC8072803 [Sorghum bicolor]XP_021304925.1 uncharacterized protein LOC8072803 [Sorghum bicolor]EER89630.1 hypothetical protein SORBI_3010G122200 [Sorghum bicolor]KAG0513992.1 hypothetical protein BDA96_10G150700 [Sorghum bicolor]KAG0513993.1 hypothetical protein BDA96_10G150700 [Sorghum bicolor]KXG19824.1 hypothetical protein SORBI_3010G122200 [Sorghum bicolor]OQU76265.1 hypothetical protein SORBI_3010G122200 [Sorghum bicolor]|eukprot:XP_002438263.1 uncharacterized protein LOC8072803 [Sorghum bicolor]
MATDVQIERAIAPANTTTTPEASNDEVENSNAHDDSDKVVSIATAIGGGGSTGQDSMGDSSTRSSLVEFDFLWKLRKYLVLLASLAVGVTYNSGLTPPGGFWNKTKDGHEAGDPALRVEFYERYEVFFYCNATAFAASLVLIILLLSKRVTKQELWLRSMQFTMLVDLFSLMAAYVAGSCRALKSSIYILVLFIIAFAYILIHILVSTRIVPETFKKKVTTKVNEILSKLGIPDVQSSRKEKKDLEEARKFILMLVTFAATATYQAGLSPPGGFWAENDYKQRPATPVLRRHYLPRYNIFISCNSTSFVASLVTIILLLSPELSRHGIRSKAVIVCVLADLFFLIGAYAAGCCRDVATSFYVMFIIIIVLICIVLLAWIFAYDPVAECLRNIKSSTKRCMSLVLSSNGGSIRLSHTDQEGSNARYQQASVHGPGAPTGELELQSTVNQHVSNTESSVEYPPMDNQKTENTGKSFSTSWHTSANIPQSENTKDMSNLKHESTDNQLVPNMESLTSTEHPSFSYQETSDSNGMSADRQQVVGVNDGKSSDDVRTTDMPATGSSEQTMLVCDSNGATNDVIEDERPSLPAETVVNVESAEQHSSMGYSNHDIENGGVNNNAEHENGNGHINSHQGAPDKNSHGNSTEDHLEKTRTYLLLLAILAVSLTYQSGLNPPGGFWSRSENNHSAGDRVLEDNDHPRFIAFFYLNAVAFVASIVIIVVLLEKTMSRKVTKHRVLQLAMIVDLLSLTGAFVMGSCREPKKSISTSILLFLVPAYVALHVLAFHVISPLVPDKVKQLSCGNVWSAFVQLCHKQTGNKTEAKELERRRNLLLTLSIIAATVTYQAGINPPGSVWSDDKDVSGRPGNPILQDNHPRRYDVFYYSNSISFVSSVAITILLVNKESCEHGIKSYALRVCLVVGLVGLLVAYVAGSCRYQKQSIFVIIIAVAVLVSLVIQVLLSSMYETLRTPLAKLMDCLQQLMESLQKWFFRTEEVRREIIIPESQETKECGKKRERKRHKYLMLIATLAASVTYQAGLNPPGGFRSDDDDNGHFAGDPLLRDINHRRYKTFFCFNAISFMASIVVIMLLLSKSIRKKPVRLEVLLLIMILDLLSVMTAFAAGSCRKLSTSIYVFLLVAGVVIYLVFFVVISRAIGKCHKKWKTVVLFCSRCTVCVSSTSTSVPR